MPPRKNKTNTSRKAPASGAHTAFKPVTGKTMRCDFCNARNDSSLQQCMDCQLHFCHDCVTKGKLHSDAKHKMTADAINNLNWVAPRARRGAHARAPAEMEPEASPPLEDTIQVRPILPSAYGSPIGRQPALSPNYNPPAPGSRGDYVGDVGAGGGSGDNNFQYGPPTADVYPAQRLYGVPGVQQFGAHIPSGQDSQMYGAYGYGGGAVPLLHQNSRPSYSNAVQPAYNGFYGASGPMMYSNSPEYLHGSYPQQAQSSYYDRVDMRRPQPLHRPDQYFYGQRQGQGSRDAVPRFATFDYHGRPGQSAAQDFGQHVEMLQQRDPSPRPSLPERMHDTHRAEVHPRYGLEPQNDHTTEANVRYGFVVQDDHAAVRSRQPPEIPDQRTPSIRASDSGPGEPLDRSHSAGQGEPPFGADEGAGYPPSYPPAELSPYERAAATWQAYLALAGGGLEENNGWTPDKILDLRQVHGVRLPFPPPRPGFEQPQAFPSQELQLPRPTTVSRLDDALWTAGNSLQSQEIAADADTHDEHAQPRGASETISDPVRFPRRPEHEAHILDPQIQAATEVTTRRPLPVRRPAPTESPGSGPTAAPPAKRRRLMRECSRQPPSYASYPSLPEDDTSPPPPPPPSLSPPPVRGTPVPGSEEVQEALSSNRTLGRVRRREGELAALEIAQAANALSAVSRDQSGVRGGLDGREQPEIRANEQEIERRRETAASSSGRGSRARQGTKRQRV